MVKVLISKENGMYGYPDGIKSTWFHRDAIILSILFIKLANKIEGDQAHFVCCQHIFSRMAIKEPICKLLR